MTGSSTGRIPGLAAIFKSAAGLALMLAPGIAVGVGDLAAADIGTIGRAGRTFG